jgi:hypothetical protein
VHLSPVPAPPEATHLCAPQKWGIEGLVDSLGLLQRRQTNLPHRLLYRNLPLSPVHRMVLIQSFSQADSCGDSSEILCANGTVTKCHGSAQTWIPREGKYFECWWLLWSGPRLKSALKISAFRTFTYPLQGPGCLLIDVDAAQYRTISF